MTLTKKKLPARRRAVTQKAKVCGQTVYLTTGHYDDGTLGEIFVDVAKCGSAVRGLLGTLARLFSVSLQYGVPLAVLTKTIKGMAFPPQGMVVGSDDVKEAVSLVDYVARELEAKYLTETAVVPEKIAGAHQTGGGW